jgi:hypothetical protein
MNSVFVTAMRISLRLRILPFPFLPLFLGEETHLERLALDPSAFLDGLEVAIDLSFV